MLPQGWSRPVWWDSGPPEGSKAGQNQRAPVTSRQAPLTRLFSIGWLGAVTAPDADALSLRWLGFSPDS